MKLDPYTIFFTLGIFSSTLSVTLLAAWHFLLSKRSLMIWGISMGCFGGGLTLIAYHNSLPLVLAVSGSNLLLMGGYCLFWWGASLHRGRQQNGIMVAVSLALASMFTAWFTYVDPNLHLRIIILYTFIISYLAATISTLLKTKVGKVTPMEKIMIVALFLEGLSRLGIIIGLLINPSNNSQPFERDTAVIASAGLSAISLVVWSIAIVLVTAEAVVEELKQKERETLRTKKLLDEMGEIAHVGGWELNLATREIYSTEELYNICGLDRSFKLTFNNLLTFFGPDSKPVIAQAVKRTIESGEPFNLILEIITTGGGSRWVRARGKANRTTNCIYGSILDVTERQLEEEALRTSEEKFRSLFEGSMPGIITTDVEMWRFTDANPSLCRMFGYSKAEFLRLGTEDLHPKNVLDQLISEFTSHMQGEKKMTSNFPCLRKDGTIFYADISTAFQVIKGRKYAVGFFADVTNRKIAEDDLRKSEAHFRVLVKTIPDLVWLKDKEGVFLACNPIFEGLLGAGEADIIGKTDYDFVDREIAGSFVEHDRKAMAAGEPTRNEEWLTFADDGHRALHETIKTPMYDDRGDLIGVLGIARDITERKRAEEEKLKLETQLRQNQKHEAIGLLAGGIAHDFNNILSAILGFTELARDKNPANEQLQEDLNEVYTAGIRAKELVQQILTFSRQQKSTPYPVDVPTIVKETLKLVRSPLQASIAMEMDIDESVGPVLADPSKLHQIVMNLCTNAAHAMEESGGTLTVKVSENTPADLFFRNHPNLVLGSYIKLIIQDTGTGIAPEMMGAIFDPYFTTKNLGDGTGLGLAVTYGIIQEMGGEITAESEPGQGSIFTVFLPVTNRELQDDGSSDPTDFSSLKGNERILLVDDEPQILKFTTWILETNGYTVTTARDGQFALDIFKCDPSAFDLIISDVHMPKLSGNKLAQQILDIRPAMPILLASGYSKNISEESVLQAGVKDLLQKPISEKKLLTKIRQMLDRA